VKILFVGESEKLLGTVSVLLKVRWPELSVLHAAQSEELLGLIYREQPHIVMLQLGEEPAGCSDLITQIRSFSDVPLIVLGQSNDVVEKVRVLEMGADDWITGDCMSMEFIAKVNALLRRCYPHSNNHIPSFLDGKLSVNCATHEVCLLEEPVKLTPIEYKILCELVRNVGSVVDRARLLHNVWGPNYEADPEFLKKYIYRLRSKIEEDPANPKIIINERGVGYRLAIV